MKKFVNSLGRAPLSTKPLWRRIKNWRWRQKSSGVRWTAKERLQRLYPNKVVRVIKMKEINGANKNSNSKMIEKKADDHSNPKNFRPISITSCLCRILERIILQWLHDYLKENNILIKNQSGFRAHRSTRDNLVFLIQKIKKSFNWRRKSIAIFFDIEPAFDKVWHEGLIFKLSGIKIPKFLIQF